MARSERPSPEITAARPAQARPGSIALHLPDGTEILCQTPSEALFLFRDIFEKEIYCRHGVNLDGVECVFDVGANIGLFTLFVGRNRPGARIFAFEPAPPVFEILRANVERAGLDVELFQCGVADRNGTAELTFYPSSSGMSSFHAEFHEEKQALYQVMLNQLRRGEPGMEEVMEHADDLLEERLRSVVLECPLCTISEIIRRHGVERIDLLKIDVQKSELDVIRGIDEEHWPRIRQIVLELHNVENRFHWLRGELEKRGFRVLAEQEDAYQDSIMLNVFATRAQSDVVASSAPRFVAGRADSDEARKRAQRMRALRRRAGDAKR